MDDTEQPEVDERHDSILVEGDDADHVLPPTELDPYTPEPGPAAGERRPFAAMWIAIAILLGLLAVVIVAAVR
jgi:hypothetical protein